MAKPANPECFYCGAICSTGNIEWDHFPIPANLGGTVTVPSCVACHDMKDRYPLNGWPTDWMGPFLKDFHLLSRESKLVLAKIMRLVCELFAKIPTPEAHH
jgi:hypothetical protein